MHTGKIGMDQVEIEIIMRPFGIETHLALKIEPERRIVGMDMTVECLFRQTAVETQRVIRVIVELQLRNATVDARVDRPVPNDSVHARFATDAPQIALSQHLSRTKSVHGDTPLQRSQLVAVGRLHRQFGRG